LVDERFASTDAQAGIRRIVANKNKHNWQKIELYLRKYKDKLKNLVEKYEDETVTN
jgi:hypothetical protein